MKSRKVSLSEEAQEDLIEIEIWLETQTSKEFARNYTDRLADFCLRLDIASRRGTDRSDLLPNLRTVGFERRITIAFIVEENEVLIVRVFKAGRDWESDLSDE